MELITGRPIAPGVSAGPIHILRQDTPRPDSGPCPTTPQRELDRFHLACRQAAEELAGMESAAQTQAGQTGTDLLHIHAMLLEDPDFLETSEELIRNGATAQEGVMEAGQRFADAFSAMDDPYLQARAADITGLAQDVSDRITGRRDAPLPAVPVLLAAESLSPAQLLGWGRERLLGLVLTHCAPSSHTAILARAMELPTVQVSALEEHWQGRQAVLDGTAGQLRLDPDAALLSQVQTFEDNTQEARQPSQFPAVTLDGRKVALLSNIGHPEEAGRALARGAEGIGLFRSEFLFLDRDCCPTEEEQFLLYRQVVQAMEGRRVVIRTLDAGADKPLPYLDLPREENPALGRRGIRLSLTRPGLFRPQLRAILRAAAFGPVSLMFPMVSALDEVIRGKALLEECRRELEAEGVPMGPVEVGIMIETPAAALIAGELAREVSFFSIGTNDLTQYALAADRQEAAAYDPHHPAVLTLIGMAVEAAHRHGCRVALCGELGADFEMTEQLLRLGVDELSASPSALPGLRRHIRELDLR